MTSASAGGAEKAYDLFRRGSAFLDAGHPGQAALLLARALRIEPEKTSIREALGRACFALGEFERALDEFATIVAKAPTNDYAQFALGMALQRVGRSGEARTHLKIAQALAPASERYRAAVARLTDLSSDVGA
jgi:Flp pilus assembly protein TadD